LGSTASASFTLPAASVPTAGGRRTFERVTKPANPAEVKPGEVKDLGEIRVKRARGGNAE
jgi:hypothetical protein